VTNGQEPHGAIINKLGQVISPDNLIIFEFYGEYAIARNEAGKFGVVNRNFEFVIKPEFDAIRPQSAEYYSVEDAYALHSKPPLFYYASKNENAPPVVLSLKGQVLFELPKGVHFPNWPPRVYHNLVVCPVWIDPNHSKDVYLNMEGKEVEAPFQNLSQSKDVTFREIAPGILLKTIKCSDELYEKKVRDSSDFRP
jgi:hypothetical protein